MQKLFARAYPTKTAKFKSVFVESVHSSHGTVKKNFSGKR